GRHERAWTVLGAHPMRHQGREGVAFSVWAPNAAEVQVAGDFNGWDGARTPLRRFGESGLWEGFAAEAGTGSRYKFRLRTGDGRWVDRADPMARFAETPPATASIVFASEHEWRDADWMRQRAASDPLAAPMSVYEVHLGSWRPGLGYGQLADELI